MKTSTTILATGLCLVLGACGDEPSESAMRETLTRAIMASYRQHVAGMALVGTRMPPEPAITAFKSYGCTPAVGAPGYVCEIDFAVNGVDKGRGKGRFYRQADGTLAVADR